MSKQKPTGYVARCQCDEFIGAVDLRRTDRETLGRLVGGWLADGCTLFPRFGGSWSVGLDVCRCGEDGE